MPLLKPISGHTSCRGVYRYLTKDGRALDVCLADANVQASVESLHGSP